MISRRLKADFGCQMILRIVEFVINGPNFAEKYGMNKEVVYPHSFRHRFAKNFLDRFNDLALLADLMGHESIETTRIYLRRTASEQQKIVDKVVNW
jgi:site-specific recombinase XerD